MGMDRRFPGRWPGGFHSGRLFRILAVFALIALALVLGACSITDDPQSTIAQDGQANERIWFVYNFLWVGAAVVFGGPTLPAINSSHSGRTSMYWYSGRFAGGGRCGGSDC